MKNVKTHTIVMAAAVAALICVGAAFSAPVSAASAQRQASALAALDDPGVVLAQSPNDYGACYTWNRVNPFQEMCNQTTRDYCEAANSVFVGSRFVQDGVCPDNS